MKNNIPVLFLVFITITATAQNFKTNYLKYSSTGLNSESGADFVDYDGDGKLDVLAGFESRKHLILYKNISHSFQVDALTDTSYGYGYIKRVDFNQDGFDDILVTQRNNTTRYSVFLYLNDGTYNYTKHFVFSSGYEEIERIEVADMDGDGDQDLVIDLFANANVFYLVTNLGNNTFARSNISFVGQPAELYGLADLNNDGLTDVVGAYYNFSVNDYILVAVENDTAATNGFIVHPIDTMDNTNEGAVGNFVGDSLTDIFLSAQTGGNTAAVWQNNGNFTFSLVAQPSVPTTARIYLPNDYDGDGKLDVILNTFTGLEILKNNGNNTFVRQVISPDAYGTPVAWDDFNNDGLNDILIASRGIIHVYAQNPAGLYTKFWANDDLGSGNLAIFDVDLNGKKDVVSSDYYSITSLNQTFTEEFLPTIIQDSTGLTINTNLRDFFPFDKDGDGDMDLLVGQGNNLYLLTNNQGVYSATIAASGINSARGIQQGDFDQDGNPDFIVIGNTYTWLEWNGTTFSQNSLNQSTPHYAIMDVDLDGDEDILYHNYDVSLQQSQLHYLKNTNGTFTSTFIQNTKADVGSNATNNDAKMHHGDIDQDGDEDLFIVNYNQNKVVWYRNDSNAVFTPFLLSDTINYPKEIRLIDIDGDNDLDILLTSLVSTHVFLFTNDSNENFTSSLFTSEVSRPTNIVVDDFDEDGDDDVFITSPIDAKAVWFENLQIDCPRSFGATADSICVGDSLFIGNTWVNTAGNYIDSLTNAAGCDSLVQFDLATYMLHNSLLQDSLTLYTNQVFAEYNWYKNDTLLITSANDSIDGNLFGTGNYWLVARNANGCLVYSDTITLAVHNNFSIPENQWEKHITIFPNPANQQFNIQFIYGNQPDQNVTLYNSLGAEIAAQNYAVEQTSGGFLVKTNLLPPGLYLVEIRYQSAKIIKKIVLH